VLLFITTALAHYNDRVLLKDINVLTLYKGRSTTYRRTYPVPQLKCVAGNGCYQYDIKSVQCYNMGFDGKDQSWKCETLMDPTLRFTNVKVNCEGYSYSNDPYVLVGSCGIEYELHTKQEFQYDFPFDSFLNFIITICIFGFMLYLPYCVIQCSKFRRTYTIENYDRVNNPVIIDNRPGFTEGVIVGGILTQRQNRVVNDDIEAGTTAYAETIRR